MDNIFLLKSTRAHWSWICNWAWVHDRSICACLLQFHDCIRRSIFCIGYSLSYFFQMMKRNNLIFIWTLTQKENHHFDTKRNCFHFFLKCLTIFFIRQKHMSSRANVDFTLTWTLTVRQGDCHLKRPCMFLETWIIEVLAYLHSWALAWYSALHRWTHVWSLCFPLGRP